MVRAVVDRVGQIILDAFKGFCQMDAVFALWLGDDMGFKTATLLCPEHLREYILPWHQRYAELAHGIRHLGGEPRAPQPYCEPGAVADVLAAWREVLADRAVVLTREEAVAAGWFGPVTETVLPRIGDLVVAMRGRATVLDSRALRTQVLRLRGHHGSLTAEEVLVPLLHRPG